jgi:hypothetical protein
LVFLVSFRDKSQNAACFAHDSVGEGAGPESGQCCPTD